VKTALLDTHVLPKGIAGCAKVTIQLSLVDNPGNILETVNYDYEVNVNGDCSAVSVVNVSKAQASVYPNPVQGEFFPPQSGAAGEVYSPLQSDG
jgi:hypothetical protein